MSVHADLQDAGTNAGDLDDDEGGLVCFYHILLYYYYYFQISELMLVFLSKFAGSQRPIKSHSYVEAISH